MEDDEREHVDELSTDVKVKGQEDVMEASIGKKQRWETSSKGREARRKC